jgi:broad specificity phosphatase PhoE
MRLPAYEGGTRLFLIRHLEPDASVSGRAYGSLDVPLAPVARKQAEELAVALEEIPFAAVYSSPLRRALGTAGPIAARHGLEPLLHEGLRELDLGEFEGERFEDLERDHPATYAALMSDPTSVRFPGGESFSVLRARATAAVEEIRERHRECCVAVVAHGGVTRAILAAALEMPDRALFRLDQAYGAVSVIDWFAASPVVRLVNADLLGVAEGRA